MTVDAPRSVVTARRRIAGGTLAVIAASALWVGATALAAGLAPPVQEAILGQGAHRAHVRDGSLHAAYPCDACHDSDDAGQVQAAVSLAGFNAATKTCTVSCHGSFPGGIASNAPSWTARTGTGTPCGSCHTARPISGAHTAHLTTVMTAPLNCETCHAGTVPARRADGAVDVRFGDRAGADAAWTGAACTNAACHSNGRGRYAPMSWNPGSLTCTGCHDGADSALVQMSGRHAFHLRVGVGCRDCHGGVVKAADAIADSALHINGKADIRILGGRYDAATCFPVCHEPRNW